MAKKIQIYVMNKDVTTHVSLEGRPLTGADQVHYCSVKEVAKTERITSEEDKAALKFVEQLAAQRDLRFQVIDVASLIGKLRAKLKGVKVTPTIIVDNKRLVGVPKAKEFEALLNQN